MLSPSGLVDALRRLGELNAAAFAEAAAAIAGGGPAWPDEPEPEPGRPMFLTSLAVRYLDDAGLLRKLSAFSRALVVLPDVPAFADGEIAAGETGARVRAGIERIRVLLARRHADRALRVGPFSPPRASSRRREGAPDGDPAHDTHPIVNMMRDGGGVEAFVCDDRAINKHPEFTDAKGATARLLTTPDVLAMMNRAGRLSDDELAAAVEKLCVGAAALVPLRVEGVVEAAAASDWRYGPGAELRAIRDAVHLPLAAGVVQFPEERPWFRVAAMTIAFAARQMWERIEDPRLAERAASYLLDMVPDAALWAAGDESPDRDLWVQDTSRRVVWAVTSHFNVEPERVEAYRRWIDGFVAPRAERRDPGVMDAVGRTLFAFLSQPLEDDDDG